MKLVTFVKSGEERWACSRAIPWSIRCWRRATAIFASALSFIKSGAAGHECGPRDPGQSAEAGSRWR